MPHSIFLGSALATQDRISESPDKLARVESTLTVDSDATVTSNSTSFVGFLRACASHMSEVKERLVSVFRVDSLHGKVEPKSHAEHENNSYTFVRAHIYHGMIDIAISLLGLAVVINSLSVSDRFRLSLPYSPFL